MGGLGGGMQTKHDSTMTPDPGRTATWRDYKYGQYRSEGKNVRAYIVGRASGRRFLRVLWATGGRMRSLKVAALIALFLAAIVAANLTLTAWGPSAIIPNAFFLIGLDFITRDRLADFWGTRRIAKQALLIVAGGALSYWLNRHAATIAVASTVSFAAAEVVTAVAYHLLRRQRWIERAPKSSLLGAAVDSVVFPTLAFGAFAFSTSFTQFAAKVAGAFVWGWVIDRLTSPSVIAPESA